MDLQMMEIFSTFLIAVALAIDCFAVSVSIGLCRKETPRREILLLGFFFGVFQTGMTVMGFLGGKFLAEFIGTVDHWIAFGLLGFIGIRMLMEAVRGGEKQVFAQKLSYRTLAALAVATSLDALAVGVSIGLLGREIVKTSAIIGSVAFLFAIAGVHFGKRIGKKFPSGIAEACGGIVLIALGVKILAEHLGE